MTDRDTIAHLAGLANALPVRPHYAMSCGGWMGRTVGRTTLTFVREGGEAWEVRIVDGCDADVEIDGYPELMDQGHRLRDAVESAIGGGDPGLSPTPTVTPTPAEWPGQPDWPTPVPTATPTNGGG